MEIGILRIGKVELQTLDRLLDNLTMIFPSSSASLIDLILQLPKEALNEERRQYRSDAILNRIDAVLLEEKDLDKILGITEADIYASGMNYVFGEARCPGFTGIISLFRLKEEFYERVSNRDLLTERTIKEAVHELGHTLGLAHCSNPFCVMYFSNSIFETDRKRSLFCSKCHKKVEAEIDNMRN